MRKIHLSRCQNDDNMKCSAVLLSFQIASSASPFLYLIISSLLQMYVLSDSYKICVISISCSKKKLKNDDCWMEKVVASFFKYALLITL